MNFVEWGNKCLEEQNEKKRQHTKIMNRKYYESHYEEALEQSKVWKKAHPEKVETSRRKWKYANPEKQNACVRNWEKAHPKRVREMQRRIENRRRRDLGFIPLNTYFAGSEAHHLDENYVVYIPQELHRSIRHCLATGKNMEVINLLVLHHFEKIREAEEVVKKKPKHQVLKL